MKWLFTALLLGTLLSLKAQTVLYPGELAFTGYSSHSSDPAVDTFSFIILKPEGISGGTQIGFTDNGWISASYPIPDNNRFRQTEGELQWTAPPGGLSYGDQVRIWTTGGKSNFGTDTGVIRIIGNNAISLSVSGDQLFIYQGDSLPHPQRIIAGLHYNVNMDTFATNALFWDSLRTLSASVSAKPPQLGNYGIWVHQGTQPLINAFYMGGVDTTGHYLQGKVLDTLLWTGDLSGPPSFTLPPSNTWALPLELEYFRGIWTTSGWLLNWKTNPPVDRWSYHLEWSSSRNDWQFLQSFDPQKEQFFYVDPEALIMAPKAFRLLGTDLDGRKTVLGMWVCQQAILPDELRLQWVGNTWQGKNLEGTIFTQEATSLTLELLHPSGLVFWRTQMQLPAGTNGIYFQPELPQEGWYWLILTDAYSKKVCALYFR